MFDQYWSNTNWSNELVKNQGYRCTAMHIWGEGYLNVCVGGQDACDWTNLHSL